MEASGGYADRDKHDEMGLHDGWSTVAGQLAAPRRTARAVRPITAAPNFDRRRLLGGNGSGRRGLAPSFEWLCPGHDLASQRDVILRT